MSDDVTLKRIEIIDARVSGGRDSRRCRPTRCRALESPAWVFLLAAASAYAVVACGSDGASNHDADSAPATAEAAAVDAPSDRSAAPDDLAPDVPARDTTPDSPDASCGGAGQSCCGANFCATGGCCIGGTCFAAGVGCPGFGGICRDGACGACGGAGGMCCPSPGSLIGPPTVCTAGGNYCSPGGRCEPCGDREGAACCPTWSTPGSAGPTCVAPGLTCRNNACVR